MSKLVVAIGALILYKPTEIMLLYIFVATAKTKRQIQLFVAPFVLFVYRHAACHAQLLLVADLCVDRRSRAPGKSGKNQHQTGDHEGVAGWLH